MRAFINLLSVLKKANESNLRSTLSLISIITVYRWKKPANKMSPLLFPGGYNHLRSPVCQDESQRDETSPPPHSHSTQPTSHSSTPNSNNNNNNNNNANNAYIHLRNLNQLKTECEYFAFIHLIILFFDISLALRIKYCTF